MDPEHLAEIIEDIFNIRGSCIALENTNEQNNRWQSLESLDRIHHKFRSVHIEDQLNIDRNLDDNPLPLHCTYLVHCIALHEKLIWLKKMMISVGSKL